MDPDGGMLTLLNVMLPPPTPHHQLHYQSVKLQLNAGADGCFPLHFDSDAAVDGRRVTALTYLNPDWTPGDGGELVLYPFPGAPVKVEPLMGRVVLFSAANMLHRVLPSKKKRLCFTTWLFAKSAAATATAEATTSSTGGGGSSTSSGIETPAEAKRFGGDGSDGGGNGKGGGATAAAEEARALLAPNLRKHLMKVIFAQEWAESIVAAHPDSTGRTAALETHWREVDVIARALAGKYPAGLDLVAKVSTVGGWAIHHIIHSLSLSFLFSPDFHKTRRRCRRRRRRRCHSFLYHARAPCPEKQKQTYTRTRSPIQSRPSVSEISRRRLTTHDAV